MAIDKETRYLILGGSILAVAYFGLLRPITNKLGLTKSDAERAQDLINQQATANKGWSPTFWREVQKTQAVTLKTQGSLEALAKDINKGFGLVYDNYNQIAAQFRYIRSQVQLSQLVAKYAELYKDDLLTRLVAPWYQLKDGLTPEQFAEISKIVNQLPVNIKP